jgi:pSer/pThr/pTyr-binding forkhead associated (FHA) protein
MTSVEEELHIPADASLPVAVAGYILKAATSSVAIAAETSLHSRCWLVGRQAATADLRIQHGSISRKHAAFYIIGGQLMLQDFGGKHGTHVNGQLLNKGEPIQLKQGDSILFGNVRDQIFSVQIPSATTKVPSQEEDGATSTKQSAAGDTVLVEQAEEKPEAAKTREGREAQIAAMVASFDEKATYTKFESKEAPVEETASTSARTAKQMSVAKRHGLPIAEEFLIDDDSFGNDTKKPSLTSLVVDKSGSRFAVGCGPYLKFYDFSGMNRKRTTPFKTILVEDGYNVEYLCYSTTGDRILAATASSQPSVLDRDGELM